MSRYYGMSVTITGHKPELAEAIRDAATEEWPFEEWDAGDEKLTAYQEYNLYGGESEEQFTERITLAVWRTNGAYTVQYLLAFLVQPLVSSQWPAFVSGVVFLQSSQ
jgi:hypothetical protein